MKIANILMSDSLWEAMEAQCLPQAAHFACHLKYWALFLLHTGHGSRAACTVFARSEAGIVGSNPTQGMDV
jgi:hypothetical protein